MAVFYNLLLHGLLILFAPIWSLLLILKPRYRKGMGERLGRHPLPSSGVKEKPSIWVHASSLGEVKVSVPLCKALQEAFPGYPLVFSASTPVGKRQVLSLLKGVQAAFLLPLDLPWVVCPVVKRLRPGFMLVAETEFWPNLFFCLKRRGIPIAVFNGRISDKSFGRYRLLRFFFKRVLSGVDLFCMQTRRDAARIQALGVPKKKVRVTGNVKFDAPYVPLTPHEREGLKRHLRLPPKTAVWVAGSVHPEEFPVLLEANRLLREADPQAKWIVIPRHLYDVEKFKKALDIQGLSWALWEGKTAVSTSWDILLVHALGQLVRVYQLGFAAFVGGSLAPVGGHNPLEPLRYGIPTFFGPYMENFREIRDTILSESVGAEVSSASELASALIRLVEDPGRGEDVKGRCLEFFEKYRGATRRSIEILVEWIKSGPGLTGGAAG